MVDIKSALAKLDVANDNHWTQDGAPRLDTVKMFAGDQTVTRETITQAAPGFSRATALQAGQATQPVGAATTPTPPQEQPTASTETAPVQDGLPDAVKPAPPGAEETVNQALSELEEAEDDLAHAKANLEQGKAYKAKVDAEVAKAQKEVDRIQGIVDALQPKIPSTHAVQGYLAQQRKNLEARAEQIRNARKFETDAGVRIVDLLPKRAPIDAARARRK